MLRLASLLTRKVVQFHSSNGTHRFDNNHRLAWSAPDNTMTANCHYFNTLIIALWLINGLFLILCFISRGWFWFMLTRTTRKFMAPTCTFSKLFMTVAFGWQPCHFMEATWQVFRKRSCSAPWSLNQFGDLFFAGLSTYQWNFVCFLPLVLHILYLSNMSRWVLHSLIVSRWSRIVGHRFLNGHSQPGQPLYGWSQKIKQCRF